MNSLGLRRGNCMNLTTFNTKETNEYLGFERRELYELDNVQRKGMNTLGLRGGNWMNLTTFNTKEKNE